MIGGSGGIRTHVPLRTTAFRVRLVMTTSIRFQAVCQYITERPKGQISFVETAFLRFRTDSINAVMARACSIN